ncbi:MAG: DUF3604 domain-containing protein, partial [Candidatus Sumerlaeota bacterium]|nr:DUF3604 domain-containing protein [Candidatus Sumerlaeota bacterium]
MSAENPKPLGLATISPASPVRAGAWGTWTIRYVAPASGVDDGGALRIGIRSITDWGRPQLDDPAGDHYLTVSCSNPETRLVAQWRMSGNFRPYAPHLSIEVQDAPLAEGDEIVVTFGDRRGGSCGTRAQTYAQHWFDFRVYVDRFGTGIFDLLVDSPGLTIVPNEPKRLACVATGDGSAAHPVRLLVRAEDEWGNPVNEAVPGRVRLTFRGAAADLPKTIELAHGLWRRNGVRCSGEGVLRIRAEHPALGATECNPLRIAAGESGLHPYWGDLHGQSQETIGTNPAESYFRFARDKSLCDVCAHQGNDLQVTDAFWSAINRLTRKFTREGRFVAFPGYEWSGTTPAGGDHNVIYLDEGAGIFRSSTTQVRGETRQSEDCHPITKLYEALKSQGRPCLLIAHVGGRRANLDFHDPDLDRLVEIHSCWGTFEWLYHDALRRGRRVGVAANSDGHRGRPGSESPGAGHFGVLGGLTCVLAESFTRAAVFEALRARRCYATSGPRIVVDARLDDSVIGSEWKTDSSELPLSGRVHGTAGIERIDLLAAGREI